MSMDDFVRGKVLGKGSFGSAILVTSKKDGKSYVIKEIDISRMPQSEREAAKQEARLLMALKHPNIVKCHDCFTWQNKLCIVMEHCSEGDLYSILQKRKGQPLDEDTIMDWFVQICLGMKHVHDRKILHRDIKSQNIFVSSNGLLKLGDFGVSKVLASTMQLAATAVGTPYYLSPEICQNKKYNQKSDIWSLGCVLYEMTCQKQAFDAPSMRVLISKVIKGTYNPVPSTRSKELRDLIARMLTLDWNKRPSTNDLLALPVCKARIEKFLSSTLQMDEFSHTIIHGRPKPGQLVVEATEPRPSSSAGSGARPASSSGPKAAEGGSNSQGSNSHANGSPARPPSRSAAGGGHVVTTAAAAAAAAAAAGAGARPSSRASAGASPAPLPPGRAPSPGGGGVRASAPAPAAAAAAKPAERRSGPGVPPAAPVAPSAGAAARAKEEEARKKLERDMSALAAQRDMERLKLAEAQKQAAARAPAAAAAAPAAGQRKQWQAPEPAAGRAGGVGLADRLERRRTALEQEKTEREAELIEFQKRHFKEAREAAMRNRQRVMGQLFGPGYGGAPAPAASKDPKDGAPPSRGGGDADGREFAAMVKDMADIVGGRGGAAPAGAGGADDSDDDDEPDVLSGKFVVNGEEIRLPIKESDSLGVKVEALRLFLERRLGVDRFLKVYRKLESVGASDADAAEKEIEALVGAKDMPYIQLVRKLIVCEEQWEQDRRK